MKLARTLIAGALLAATAWPTFALQPHMDAAMNHLEQALAELKQASNDKGGNRTNAIRAVEKAIAEVKRGIDYDRAHAKPGEGR